MKQKIHKLLLEVELPNLTDSILQSSSPYEEIWTSSLGRSQRQVMKKKQKLEY